MKTINLTTAECDDVREAILCYISQAASARDMSAGLGISTAEHDKEIAVYRALLEKF